MAQLMLINPRKRRARKAAPKHRARRNPVARASAPKRRARHNPISAANMRRVRRARRNPVGTGGIGGQVMDAAVGAGGAVLVDVIQGYIPVPASMNTGYGPYLVKGALALVLGTFGKKVLGRTAAKMGAGALTVAAYGALKQATSGILPAPAVAGLGYGSPTPVLSEYITGPGARMGEYVSEGGMNAHAFGNY